MNGATANLNGNSFSSAATFAGQGSNSVFIEARDVAGNSATQTVQYRIITGLHPPVINPKPPGVTNQNPITIAGTADPASTIHITGGASDQSFIVSQSGSFSVQYALQENQVNLISVSAVTSSEESIPETFEITHDNLSPAKPVLLNYTSVVKTTKFGLLGITDPLVQVFLEGLTSPLETTASPGNGAFGFQIEFTPNSTHTVTIKAKDAAGNESEITTATIHHDPTRVQNLHISVSEPRNWTAVAGTAFPNPLEVILVDQNGEAIQGYPIIFDVLSGDGLVEGQPSTTKQTNSAGRAAVAFTLGSMPGQYNNIVRATFTGNIENPAFFMITALEPKPGEPTTVEGMVMDENFRAIPNATIMLMRDGFNNLSTLTDDKGRFNFENVAPGRYHLRADGTTTTLPMQRYPVLAYELDVFEGQVNTIGMPIFLPRTQVENMLQVSGTAVQTYTTPWIPKLKVTIPPGAVTYPDGSHSGEFIVSPVPIEVLPMPLPNGWATSLAISIQPAGTVFNPPLPITFPNVDGLPPASKATIASFDHGQGRYVPVGTATVSADGATIVSDPGQGIRFGAWHVMVQDEPCETTYGNYDIQIQTTTATTVQSGNTSISSVSSPQEGIFGMGQTCIWGSCWKDPVPTENSVRGPICILRPNMRAQTVFDSCDVDVGVTIDFSSDKAPFICEDHTGITKFIQITAEGIPPGGVYTWSTDSTHASLTNTDSPTVTVTGLSPSTSRNDVELTVTYTFCGKTATATINLTVQKPTSLLLSGNDFFSDAFDCVDLNCKSYKRVLLYTIQDQFGDTFGPFQFFAEESFEPNPPTSTCAPLALLNANVLQFGSQFEDTFAVCRSICPSCNPSGHDCTDKSTQASKVDGCPVRRNAVTWTCFDASIVEVP